MKSAKLILTSMVVALLSGCGSSPSIPEGSTVDDFVRTTQGKTLNLLLKRPEEPILLRSQNGKYDEKYGMIGIGEAFKPAEIYCRNDGGDLIASDKKTYVRFDLPTKLTCKKGDTVLWGLKPNYSNYEIKFLDFNKAYWLYVTLNPKKYTNELYVTEVKANQESQEYMREQYIEQKEAKKQTAIIAEKLNNEWRKTVASGSTIEWKVPNRYYLASGRAVKIEGNMVLVQFDNLKFNNGFTRYIPLAELLPPSGNANQGLLTL
ncbi:hypothetical protein [Endozoicomonas ascidiicola]|uniref:hypothetical protein n=1 Tax=Endozoicomonas ascidiicola TaxID=1698521 RepID=UPI000834D319|nr:hypothetical protein [Endozoicomonas ascidiicola]